MPSESGMEAGVAQRLHPASLLFSLGSAARRLLIPGIVVFFASRGGREEIWLMLLFVPAAIGALAKYLSYRYRLGHDELMVREGIVTRNERHIPYARIQNIDLVQNPLHRFLRVAEVRLETASGDKPEAVIRVLSLRAVERMRSMVFQRRREAGPAAAEAVAEERSRVLVRMRLRELLLLGLLSNRGMALVAAALGVLWQFDPLRLEEGEVERLAGRLREGLPELQLPGTLPTALLVVTGALAFFVLLKLLSVAWIVMRYHGFTLTRGGDDLRVEYGLFTRVSATIPRYRIQKISTHHGPLQRLFRMATVQVETAGGGEREEGSRADRLRLAPLIRIERLDGLLHEAVPEIEFRDVIWRELDPRAGPRVLRKSLFLALLFGGLAGAGWFPWGLTLLVPAAGLALLHARLYVRHTRYAVVPEGVLYRSGWWRRRVSAVRVGKIQVLALKESPFDRRARMASLQVDTAGAGRIGPPMEIDYLQNETARTLLDRLFGETNRVAFRW